MFASTQKKNKIKLGSFKQIQVKVCYWTYSIATQKLKDNSSSLILVSLTVVGFGSKLFSR